MDVAKNSIAGFHFSPAAFFFFFKIYCIDGRIEMCLLENSFFCFVFHIFALKMGSDLIN